MAGHVLIVRSPDPDEPDWEIQHPQECPWKYDEVLDCWIYHCAYEFEIMNVGIDAFSRGEPFPKAPGRYPIEWWHTEYAVMGGYGYEHDTGIAILPVSEEGSSEEESSEENG